MFPPTFLKNSSVSLRSILLRDLILTLLKFSYKNSPIFVILLILNHSIDNLFGLLLIVVVAVHFLKDRLCILAESLFVGYIFLGKHNIFLILLILTAILAAALFVKIHCKRFKSTHTLIKRRVNTLFKLFKFV